MRGHLRKRAKRSWTIVLDVGTDDKGKRKQRWIAVEGTKRQAEAHLAETLHRLKTGDFVEPSKVTFGEWLERWLKLAVTGQKAPRTEERYRDLVRLHITPGLGHVLLQKLNAEAIEAFYADKRNEEKPLGEATLQLIQTIIHSSLASAERKRYVPRNEAKLVDGKPRASRDTHDTIKANCWEASEANTFLATARKAGPRPAAFYQLAIETGMRKAELCGLKWEDVELDAGRVTIVRQLVRPGKEPTFRPPKGSKPGRPAIRGVDISPETVAFLRELKRHQAEAKMRNRTAYRDNGLVFTKGWTDMSKKTDCLGDPLQSNNLGQREFAKLLKASGVRRIKFHGLRHTAATLMLQEGVPVKVVSERLGHRSVTITMEIYAHALPSAQKDAAARMGALLRG